MNKLLSSSRYFAWIGILALLVTALTAFCWGVAKTVYAVVLTFSTQGHDPGIIIALVEIVDAFLVATTLLIFSLGLYELFIGELGLPRWMIIHNLHDLKTRLGSMLVLIMAVKFLEKLVEWKDAQETLFFALGIGAVAAVLIAFGFLRDKEGKQIGQPEENFHAK
jgi:uncharacterized membrane protein YqhA